MEVDLTQGSQLVYALHDIMMTIGHFYKNIQVSILTKGYEQWNNGEANLLVTRGMVGRLSNIPNVGFAYEVQVAILMQPSEVNSRNLIDGRVSLSFSGYRVARQAEPLHSNTKDEEVPSDEEIFHTIAVLIEQTPVIPPKEQQSLDPEVIEENLDIYPDILVHRISPHAKLPIRRSSSVVGYDLATSQDCLIPARGRAQGKCITQIIFERILLLEMLAVFELSTTGRGTQGFGSTDIPSASKQPDTVPPTVTTAHPNQQPTLTQALWDILVPKQQVEEPPMAPRRRRYITLEELEKRYLLPIIEIEGDTANPGSSLGNHAGDTSPGASVLWSMDLCSDETDEADSFFKHIW
ncbi:hypothetical protein ZIOFF_024634 [Zingiber officinale]|uniref:Uncharacterized protein n=1 Tax=Zingiber officinale TaxID=94328 RepID=A0A8J5GUL7_ZINOF|nr:hypothetical protein ZIOFF_024634 [Zingiber officinale]